MYTLIEYSSYTGCGHEIGRAGCIDELPWADFNALDTYLIRKGTIDPVDLAEFEGHEDLAVIAWFAKHLDYDGRDGVKAWKGICAWCDKALVDGSCNCADGRGCSY